MTWPAGWRQRRQSSPTSARTSSPAARLRRSRRRFRGLGGRGGTCVEGPGGAQRGRRGHVRGLGRLTVARRRAGRGGGRDSTHRPADGRPRRALTAAARKCSGPASPGACEGCARPPAGWGRAAIGWRKGARQELWRRTDHPSLALILALASAMGCGLGRREVVGRAAAHRERIRLGVGEHRVVAVTDVAKLTGCNCCASAAPADGGQHVGGLAIGRCTLVVFTGPGGRDRLNLAVKVGPGMSAHPFGPFDPGCAAWTACGCERTITRWSPRGASGPPTSWSVRWRSSTRRAEAPPHGHAGSGPSVDARARRAGAATWRAPGRPRPRAGGVRPAPRGRRRAGRGPCRAWAPTSFETGRPGCGSATPASRAARRHPRSPPWPRCPRSAPARWPGSSSSTGSRPRRTTSAGWRAWHVTTGSPRRRSLGARAWFTRWGAGSASRRRDGPLPSPAAPPDARPAGCTIHPTPPRAYPCVLGGTEFRSCTCPLVSSTPWPAPGSSSRPSSGRTPRRSSPTRAICGVLVVVFAVIAMAQPMARYLNTLLAVWLVIGTLAFHWASAGAVEQPHRGGGGLHRLAGAQPATADPGDGAPQADGVAAGRASSGQAGGRA